MVVALTVRPELAFFIGVAVVLTVLIVGGVYPVIAEYRYGKTVGKHLMGLRVVRESGARISFGQSVVRQLPMLSRGLVDRHALRAVYRQASARV